MLNGMPIQMFTMITATSASDVLVSQPGSPDDQMQRRSKRLSAPLSWSRIQRQTALETISGISQGSSSSERSTPLSGNRRWK